jgi:glyoxylase-like metal-dependent hydrolase (beta-lactamase superfamily II)
MLNIKAFQFNMFGVNTYVVWNTTTSDATVIDPGMIDADEEARLDTFIADNRLSVKLLICTHMHVDHIFGVAHVRNRYGVELMASHGDAFLGKQAPAQVRMFGLRNSVDPVEPDVELNDGDTIDLCGETVTVRTLPGHSPGSIILYFPLSKWVITGDVLFHGSIGRTDLIAGNHAQLLAGIHDKLMTLPADTTVYPGHGATTTIGTEMRVNPYVQ